MRNQREKFANETNKEPKEQPPEKMPSYSRQYEPPPRFQQRPNPKEKDFRLRNDFSVPPNLNSHWVFNLLKYFPKHIFFLFILEI